MRIILSAIFVMCFAACQPSSTPSEKSADSVSDSQSKPTLDAHSSPLTSPTVTLINGERLVPRSALLRALKTQFEKEAKTQFEISHTSFCPPPSTGGFKANYNFPVATTALALPDWTKIDFKAEPGKFMRSVLKSAVDANDGTDWDLTGGTGWYHAPWMHAKREPYRGMTRERGARPGNLHENQTQNRENWAIGFYNGLAATTFERAWRDPAAPETKDFVFPVGASTVKLLFTEASPTEVPYLQNPKSWDTCIFRPPANGNSATNRIAKMNLLQLDIAAKVGKVIAGKTEWVFGTFIYWNSDIAQPFSWNHMMPVSLHWGNDPDLTFTKFKAGQSTKEGWTNPIIEAEFNRSRQTASSVFSDNERLLRLGLFGRANGPVDNPKSACLACHGRAVDPGQFVSDNEMRRQLPFAIQSIKDDDAIKNKFFRNLSPEEPFVGGWESLDYSLQAAEGLKAFRTWVKFAHPNYDCVTTDIDPLPYPSTCPANIELAIKSASQELDKAVVFSTRDNEMVNIGDFKIEDLEGLSSISRPPKTIEEQLAAPSAFDREDEDI